ncbi:MAG: hypothetical protein ACJATN_000284 [Neolewinella sp.]|jgi:hypothetical protein
MQSFLLTIVSFFLSVSLLSAQQQDWEVPDVSDYQFSMSLTGAVVFAGEYSRDENDLVAFFVNDELRGFGPVSFITDFGAEAFYAFNVYANVSSGEIVEVRVYHAATDQIYVASVAYDFFAQTTMGSFSAPTEFYIGEPVDEPIFLLGISEQVALETYPFDTLELLEFLSTSDEDPIVWSFEPLSTDVLWSQEGSTLSAVANEGFTGTATVRVVATEETGNQLSDTAIVSYRVSPLVVAPDWTSISPIIAETGSEFSPVDLNDFVNSSDERCFTLDYYPVFNTTISEADPQWVYAGTPQSSMTFTTQARFTPRYIFNHPDDRLAAFIDGELAGVAAPTDYLGEPIYLLSIGSNDGLVLPVEIRFYSGDLRQVFTYPVEVLYNPSTQTGSLQDPGMMDFSPLVPTIDEFGTLSVDIQNPALTTVQSFELLAADCEFPELNDVQQAVFCYGSGDNDELLVDLSDEVFIVCEEEALELSLLVDSVKTEGYIYAWSTSGDGEFRDADGNRDNSFAAAVTYTMGVADVQAESVFIMLTVAGGTLQGCNGISDQAIIDPLPNVYTAACRDTTISIDADGTGGAVTFANLLESIISECKGIEMDISGGASEFVFTPAVLDYACDELGDNVVTVSITGPGTIQADCQVTVIVGDTIAPVVLVTDETVILNDDNTQQTLSPDDLLNILDNCDGTPNVDFDRPLTFTGADIGANTLTATITDSSGNETIVNVVVTVGFDQPSIACVGGINVALTENCGFELIPEQLLVGNTALLDAFMFAITVMDADTSNGPVIDGCGTYDYVIRSIGMGDLDLDFESCWGVVNAEDNTSPAIIATPTTRNLLCVDFESDENNVSTLSSTVGRCYMVFANDASATASGQVGAAAGAVVGGTMAPALHARLLAGESAPVVPTFTDGCSERIEVCVDDVVVYGEEEDCDDIIITRTFTATEMAICASAANESVSTSFEIIFERPSLADLDADNIEGVVTYELCGTANPTSADYPAPSPGDFPFLVVGGRIFPLQNGGAVCNISVTYSDGAAIVACPSAYKFIRTYTVIDWCDAGDIRTFNQVVKVGDTTAPTFTGPNVATDADGTLVYGTNAGNTCVTYVRLDNVSAIDSCPGTVSISAQIFPNGNLAGAPIGTFAVVPGGSPEVSSAIPAGTHTLRYIYSDVCGNTGTTDYDFRIEDQTPPVAICEDGLNLSIAGGANNGFAVLAPSNIDAGSYDDCSGVTRAIARVDANDVAIGGYGPQVTLTCADLGTVRVGLRVTDAVGNVNFCWFDVVLEDKLAPNCIAPANTTISCVDYNASLAADITESTDDELNALFGQAAGVDNCGMTISQTVSGTINSCGVGRITRTFTSTDGVGFTNTNLCVQDIDIVGVHDYRITFPTDASGDCMEVPVYGDIIAEELGCDLITTTTDVDTLRTQLVGEECFKLRVTYDVVNWCAYNSLGEPYIVRRDAPGARDRTRNPRDIEEDLLYVNVTPGTTTTTTDDDVAFYSLIGDDRTFDPAPSPQRDQEYAGYAANANSSRGFFRYTQFIKVYDEVAPEVIFTPLAECFAGGDDGCRTTVTLTFAATDECSDALATIELDANFSGGFFADNPAALGVGVSLTNDGEGNYTVTATNVPVGAHAIRVRASDGCGNVDVQIIEFCVTADRTPTPICIQTLTVALMNDGNGGGIAAIWAADFIASPIEDCFGNLVDKYSLYSTSDAGAAGFTPVAGVLGIDDIDCDDFENGTVSVRVYAFDDNGSAPDYCEVIVEVQDNMGHCDDSMGSLSGLITTQNGEAVEGVEISLTSSVDMDETAMTNAEGTYRFTGLPLNADYTVQPVFDALFNAQNIRASDLVVGISHLLGRVLFADAYQFVAADVNEDGSFDVFDILAGQRAILGLDDGFIGGNWFFVEVNTVIDMSDPYGVAFPEVFNTNDLQGTVDAGFVAVEKMNLTGATGRVTQLLNVDDAQLEGGQVRTILLDGTHLAGFQGTIELAAGLELISAELVGEGGLNLNRAGEGMIGVLLREGGVVRLQVRATASGLVSELIFLSDAVTVREGVALNGTSNALDLAFNPDFAPAAAANMLLQNTPNPVIDEATIHFILASAGPATLTLRDVAGRVLSTRKVEAIAGLNRLELTNFTTAGVITYTLTAGEFSATKKMVVVK